MHLKSHSGAYQKEDQNKSTKTCKDWKRGIIHKKWNCYTMQYKNIKAFKFSSLSRNLRTVM